MSQDLSPTCLFCVQGVRVTAARRPWGDVMRFEKLRRKKKIATKLRRNTACANHHIPVICCSYRQLSSSLFWTSRTCYTTVDWSPGRIRARGILIPRASNIYRQLWSLTTNNNGRESQGLYGNFRSCLGTEECHFKFCHNPTFIFAALQMQSVGCGYGE